MKKFALYYTISLSIASSFSITPAMSSVYDDAFNREYPHPCPLMDQTAGNWQATFSLLFVEVERRERQKEWGGNRRRAPHSEINTQTTAGQEGQLFARRINFLNNFHENMVKCNWDSRAELFKKMVEYSGGLFQTTSNFLSFLKRLPVESLTREKYVFFFNQIRQKRDRDGDEACDNGPVKKAKHQK